MSDNFSLAPQKRKAIFINILITCIATTMMATALSTALPSIVNVLHISVDTGQWLTSGYSLCMGIMIPITAFLITRFPTKNLYLISLSLFIVGLVLCIFAPNFYVMMFGRILQACANGILSSMAQVILLSIYPPEKRGAVMGWYGLTIGAAPVIAPTLAGVLIDAFNWHAIFIFPLIILVISLLFAMKSFANVLDISKKKFDLVSCSMSILAFGGISLGVSGVSTDGIANPSVLIPLIVGVIASIFFVHRQLHLKHPFLELRTLKNKNFLISTLSCMLLYMSLMASTVLLPVYIQMILGYSATISGLLVLPGSLMMTIISPLAGNIYDKFGMKKLFMVGAIALFVSNIGMSFLTIQTPVYVVVILNMIRQISTGCLLMPLLTWGTSELKAEETVHGTALLTALRTVAGSIGMSIFVGIMTNVANHAHHTSHTAAMMHGMDTAFLYLAISNILLVLLGLFVGKNRKPKIMETVEA